MSKSSIILIIVAILFYGWKAFPTAKNKSNYAENSESSLSASAILQKIESENNELYKLKGSINSVVNDSIQEEIQQAVEEGISKSQGSN